MRDLFRKLKASLTIGSIWGIAAGLVGATVGAVNWLLAGGVLGTLFALSLGAGAAGFTLGTGFGLVLSIMEGRRTLNELTANRAALWGLVVGASTIGVSGLVGLGLGAVSVPTGVFLGALAAASTCYGALTGLLAAGTVWVAKRDVPELPAGSTDAGHLIEG